MKAVMCGKFERSSGSVWRNGGEIDLEHLGVSAGKVVEMMMDCEI